jgi:hypothetical protein
MRHSKGVSQPNKRKVRVASTATQTPTCQLPGGHPDNSASYEQVQFVSRHYGLHGRRAALIASLAWEAGYV